MQKKKKKKKMATKLSKNVMFVFGLHSNSDDWLSDLSDESCPKCEKMVTKLFKKLNVHFWIMLNF